MVGPRLGLASCRILFVLFFLGHARTLTTNRTIDDEKGDSVTGLVPEYSPPGAWHQGSTCTACFVHLDTSQVLDGTWHDTTHHPGDPEPRSITMRFNGTAVYVYNALANTVPGADTASNLTFSIDGVRVGTFFHAPTTSRAFDYNEPVHTSTDLKNQEHTLVIQAVGDTSPSLILFDYLVYTFTDKPGASSSSSSQQTSSTSEPPGSPSSSEARASVAAIVGGVVGGVVALLLIALLFRFLRRRARVQSHIRVQEESARTHRARSGDGILADGDERLLPPTTSTSVNARPPRPSLTAETSDISRWAVSVASVGHTSHDASSPNAMTTPSDSMPPQSQDSTASPPSLPSGGYIHDSLGRIVASQPQVMASQVAALRKERERREERRETLVEAPPSYDDARGGPEA